MVWALEVCKWSTCFSSPGLAHPNSNCLNPTPLSPVPVPVLVHRREATFWTETPYLENSRSLSIYFYCDEEWEKAKTVWTCVDKIKLARETVLIDLDAAKFIDLRQTLVDKQLLPTIQGAAKVSKSFNHYIRTHYWYAFVADCSLEMYNHKVPPIYYNVTMKNQGDQHLPADERGLWQIHLFSFVMLSLGLSFILLKTWANVSETKSIHLVVLLLTAAVVCAVLSSFFEMVHLSVYAR